MRKIGFAGAAVASAAGIGFLVSLYGRYTAKAAVKVRPGLNDVGFFEALVTSHGGDWLFYHYPTVMTVALVVFAVVITGVAFVTGT